MNHFYLDEILLIFYSIIFLFLFNLHLYLNLILYNNHSKINIPDEEQNKACTPKSNESFFGTYNIPSHTPDLDHQLHLLNF